MILPVMQEGSEMTFGYTKKELNPFQQKKALKKAKKAEADRIAEAALELAKAELEKEKLIAMEKLRETKEKEKAKAKEDRAKARKKNPGKLPRNDGEAGEIIRETDFTNPSYIETLTTETGETRRAFVRCTRTMKYDEFDDPYEIDCWVGANIHPNSSEPTGWAPGNSYILQYPNFSLKTSAIKLDLIRALPGSRGTKPDVL